MHQTATNAIILGGLFIWACGDDVHYHYKTTIEAPNETGNTVDPILNSDPRIPNSNGLDNLAPTGDILPTTEETTETVIMVPYKFTQMSAGNYQTCGITMDNAVKCWGRRSIEPELDIANVQTLVNPLSISTGAGYACAIDAFGLTCWGQNPYGTVSNPAMRYAHQVVTGKYHACAIGLEKGLRCWGRNDHGQTDVPEALMGEAADVVVGLFHTCAKHPETGWSCFGSTYNGLLDVPAHSTDAELVIGRSHACLLDYNQVKCFGSNELQQLDSPNFNFTEISSSGDFTCGLTRDQNVQCWGVTYELDIPTTLESPNSLSAGEAHICLLDGNTPICTGRNIDHQLDIPTYAAR